MNTVAKRDLWVDYLRSFVTVLVVAHHSSLAYTTFAYFDADAYVNSTHAVVDDKRWVALDIFQGYNDVFFMPLMFLIGGLFLVSSLNRKGVQAFLRDRFFRLFVPFLLGGTLLMLLAYYPSYWIAHGEGGLIAYAKDFFTNEGWPAGPPWFIWVLFLFNVMFVVLYVVLGECLKSAGAWFSRQDIGLGSLALLGGVLIWVLYVPLSLWVGAGTWIGVGPFDVQLSRSFLYFGCLLIGVFIGAAESGNAVFSKGSAIVKTWWLWALFSFLSYVSMVMAAPVLIDLVKAGSMSELSGWTVYHSMFSATCALSCLAFLAAFRALINTRYGWWGSLSENAYGIYLLHFVFVTWSQFLLLGVDVHAVVKFGITFSVSLAGSWSISILARRVRVVGKYI